MASEDSRSKMSPRRGLAIATFVTLLAMFLMIIVTAIEVGFYLV